ncbi:MAG: hypothetical protein K1X79_13585 [Oligoflexia bacterium]|nr:hypothetical protein [Oligoflexia bacterium]
MLTEKCGLNIFGLVLAFIVSQLSVTQACFAQVRIVVPSIAAGYGGQTFTHEDAMDHEEDLLDLAQGTYTNFLLGAESLAALNYHASIVVAAVESYCRGLGGMTIDCDEHGKQRLTVKICWAPPVLDILHAFQKGSVNDRGDLELNFLQYCRCVQGSYSGPLQCGLPDPEDVIE